MGKRLHLIVDFFLQHFGMGGGEGSEHTVGGRKFVGEVKMNNFYCNRLGQQFDAFSLISYAVFRAISRQIHYNIQATSQGRSDILLCQYFLVIFRAIFLNYHRLSLMYFFALKKCFPHIRENGCQCNNLQKNIVAVMTCGIPAKKETKKAASFFLFPTQTTAISHI